MLNDAEVKIINHLLGQGGNRKIGIEEILASIEKLNENDREKVIGLIKQKYNLMNDLPREAFVASSSYEFWLDSDDDDVYMK